MCFLLRVSETASREICTSFVHLRVLRGRTTPTKLDRRYRCKALLYTCSRASPSATGTSIFFFPR